MIKNLKLKYQKLFSKIISPYNLYDKALDYFEEIIKRIALTGISIYIQNKLPDIKINELLMKLALPSLGGWNSFIGNILKWNRRNTNKINIINKEILSEIDNFINKKIDDKEFLSYYKELVSDIEKREINVMSISFRSIIDLIIRIRNKISHGGKPPEKWFEKIGKLEYNIINKWIEIIKPFDDYLLYNFKDGALYPLEINNDESTSKQTKKLPAIKYTPAEKIIENDLFLIPKTNIIPENPINFYPFIIYKNGLFYYMNGNNRLRKAEYINHIEGESFSDSNGLLKEQITFFSQLKGKNISKEELGSTIATSLAELGDILKGYEGIGEGKILGGDFKLLHEIGRGGMGIVYKALHISHNRLCAVKVLPKSIVSDDTIFYRFKREAETLEAFDHLNIVEFIDFGESDDDVYLAMEYIDGIGLDEIFNALRIDTTKRPTQNDLRRILNKDSNVLPISFLPSESNKSYYHKIIDWIISIADALSYIHSKYSIHRDVKLSNIMIERSTGRAILLDFGLAKTQDVSVTMEGQFLGTLRYASPEQVQSIRHVVDQKSDIYSLGAVLYELLALRPLFISESIKQMTTQIMSIEPPNVKLVASDIPTDLETITHKCLEKDPKHRFQSAIDLRDDMLRWKNDEPIKAKPPTAAQKLKKWTKRNPGIASGIAVGIAAIIIIIMIISMSLIQVNEQKTIAELERNSAQRELEARLIAEKEKNRKDLLLAVNKNDIERISMLIEYGVDLNIKDDEGNSPLWISLQQGYIDITKLLLSKEVDLSLDDDKPLIYFALDNKHKDIAITLIEKGANINYIIETGELAGFNTLLYSLYSFGNSDIAVMLIEKGADIKAKTPRGATALHYAAIVGLLDITKMLVERGADIDAKNKYDNTPLSMASYKAKKEVVEFLIENNADVNAKNTDGETPLLRALTNFGHSEVAKILIENGADVNTIDNNGKTPLLRSLGNYKETDIPIILIKKGADINIKDHNGNFPLHMACFGNIEWIKQLLEKGVDINAKNKIGQTPLMIAADRSIYDAVKLLIDNGADVNIKSNYGGTALYYACSNKNIDIVNLLIEKNAITNFKTDVNWTPLHAAAYSGRTEIMKILIEKKPEINIKADYVYEKYVAIGSGWTPLHIATYFGHEDIVELLINNGADISILDNDNRTSLDIAIEKNHNKIISLLK